MASSCRAPRRRRPCPKAPVNSPTCAITQAKAGYAATFAERIAQAAAGADIAEARAGLGEAMSSEWTALGAITALCVAQVVVGVWRPAMKGRARAR